MRDTTRLRAFLSHLDRLDAEDRHDTIVSEIMEAGGKFGPLIGHYLLSLHGIHRTGPTKSAAISAWICAARKSCASPETEYDGFVTAHPDMAGGRS